MRLFKREVTTTITDTRGALVPVDDDAAVVAARRRRDEARSGLEAARATLRALRAVLVQPDTPGTARAVPSDPTPWRGRA